jgi:hypothetical protein
MKAGTCGTQPMSFILHIEHDVVGGKTVLEKFEDVESFNNPPMTDTLHLSFADERESKQLNYGNVVRASDTN